MVEIEKCPICGETHSTEYLRTKDYFLTGEQFTLKQCAGCGFVFTSPRPDDVKLSHYYQSNNYLSHHSRGFSPLRLVYQFLRKRNIRNKFRLVSQFSSIGSLLDIGCGTGELLDYFQNQGWKATGIEPDATARNFASDRWGLTVYGEDQIPTIENESYDVITMWHVLEHVSNLNERISDIHRILKNKGNFVAAVPNFLSWDAQHYGSYWAAWDLPRHLFHFSQKNIIQLTEKHGFKYIKSIPMVWDSYYISLMSEQYKGNRLPYFNAIKNGMKSNSKGRKNGNGYSSMIYIFEKS
ncbi:MAG: methyltransferase domain-containing protein [Bacteroidales bacterium]|nr:methyltransferase domain-containing protein [Bacteroidales bacterium]